MIGYRVLRNMDPVLFLAVCITGGLGILAIFNIVHVSSFQKTSLWIRQLVWFGLGLTGMITFSFVDYRIIGRFAHFIYLGAILMLGLVLKFGSSIHGTRAWFTLGPFSFQPSEFAKLAVIVGLSKYLSTVHNKINNVFWIAPVFVIIGVPILLIMKQPDLGTCLVFFPMALVLLFMSNVRISYVVSLLFIGVLVVSLPIFGAWISISAKEGSISGLLLSFLRITNDVHQGLVFLGALAIFLLSIWFGMKLLGWRVRLRSFLLVFFIIFMGIIASIGVNTFLQDYQKQRLLTFVNPLTDPLGAGYNIIQSQIAVGSGGVFGKGLFSASQSRLGFLPEQHTDFIFSAIGEKCGFFGSIVILLLYSVIIYRALNIAASTQDMFGLLMIIGVVSVLVTQIFVNIGMTIGIMPVIGLPLPFISYGGSFLFITMIEMGIICNIATSRVRL